MRHGQDVPAIAQSTPTRPGPGGSLEASALNALQATNGSSQHLATQSPAGTIAAASTSAPEHGGAGPASAVAQLGPALAALHSSPDGARHVTVRLDPAELGQVQVRITRAQDGAASVSVSVERPETLRSLQADLSHLHQALDRAGLPEQRSLSIHLATPDLGSATTGSGGQSSPQHREAQPRPPTPAGSDPPSGTASLPDPPAPARWLRAGVNITA